MKTHSFHRIAAALTCCALAAGCANPGNYSLPLLQVPGRYGADQASVRQPRETLVLNATHPSIDIAAQAWWNDFHDARLDRMVSKAIEVNADLAVAALRLRQARLQAGLARNDQWPQASGSAASSSSRPLDGDTATQRSSGAMASLSWEIDLWGRLRTAHDIAQWEAQASAEDRENTVLALAGDVCENYWNLAYLNQSIVAGVAQLSQLRQVLTMVQVQFEAGEVSLLEVREAQQNLSSQQGALSQLTQQREETRNALAILLDAESWPQEDEPQSLHDTHSPALAAGIPAELLGRRPDLRAAELRLRKALATIRTTDLSYYPALTLTGSLGTSSASLLDLLSNPIATLGAGLTLPFLNLRRMQLDTDIAGTDYEIAANQFRSTLHTALQEVNNALSARSQLALQVGAAQRSYDAARDVEQMYGVRYRAGATSLRIWLDAQQALRSAELSLAQAKRDQLRNDVTLRLALGGSHARADQADSAGS